jgi:hypothetical protein
MRKHWQKCAREPYIRICTPKPTCWPREILRGGKSAAFSAQLEPENVIKWFKLLVRWVLGTILIVIASVALFALMNRQSYQPIDMFTVFEIAGLIGCPLLALKLCLPSFYDRL